jgi:hypothetical protein
LTEYELIIDSTEQTIERPIGQQEQEKFFSGKQKSHTRKNQFIVLPKGKDIVDVQAGAPGPTSDINQFRERQEKFDSRQKFKGDKAYVGEGQISTPQKKPKHQEYTFAQKQENKAFSAKRIFVEHVIRVVKIFRIAQERFSLRKETYEQVILCVCGLVRMRIGGLILPSEKIDE